MSPLLLMLMAAPPDLYGLAVGYNLSDDPKVAPLRYADDDAVKNARLLRDLGAETVLLTELDRDSATLYEDVDASRPTRRAVEAALETLDQRMAESQAAGRRAELMIFYGGHGDVKNNEGYIQLAGGRLYRKDFRRLITQTRADAVHVVVDACKSYFLVFDRGPGGERKRVEMNLSPQSLPAHVGLLLSTSAAQDSHEWEAFQAGVFSHEVRSALRGAADIDGDGAVSYEETAAFVFGANRAIPNARYRPRFYARASSGGALLQLEGRGGDRLFSGPGISGHLFVEDQRGNRVLDFHPTQSQKVALLLPPERPLYVRAVGESIEYVLAERGSMPLPESSARKSTSQTRGAEHVAFSALFSVPFGEGTVRDYRAEQAFRPTLHTEVAPTWPSPVLGAGSAALLIAGGVMSGLAYSQRRRHLEADHQTRVSANERIRTFNVAAVLLYTLGVTTFGGWLLYTFWPEDDPEVRIQPGLSGAEVRF